MGEPTGHCPYLGLKQNRAIRFASPTPEHRCYISGEPLEIPVDQSSLCLAQGHVHCPLYMGLTVPTTSDQNPTLVAPVVAPSGGVRGWFASLTPRDRSVYALMLAMLAVIVAIYLLVGLQTLLGGGGQPGVGGEPTSLPTGLPTSASLPSATSAPTQAPPTPTDLPTSTPEPAPTDEPTKAPIILPPTQAPTSAPTVAATSAPTVAAATAAPRPTAAVTAASKPTSAPAPTATSKPSATPAVTLSVRPVTLYFSDPGGTVLVPVYRNAQVEDSRIAEAAVKELIAGPRNGLGRLVSAEATLLDISISDKVATVNFDRDPGGIDSIVLTLTEFSTVSSVQVQVKGANLGGRRARPVVNPLNPQNLPVDFGKTSFLPLYFPSASTGHDIRIMRLVPKTQQVAEATVRALIEGPGSYASVTRRVIPEGTQLRGIKLENGVVLVDFTKPFAEAQSLDAAMRTIVESLTTFPSVSGVQFLVEGNAFADGRIFKKPVINQE